MISSPGRIPRRPATPCFASSRHAPSGKFSRDRQAPGRWPAGTVRGLRGVCLCVALPVGGKWPAGGHPGQAYAGVAGGLIFLHSRSEGSGSGDGNNLSLVPFTFNPMEYCKRHSWRHSQLSSRGRHKVIGSGTARPVAACAC